MELSTIMQLRQSLDDENIDLTEIAIIEEAFSQIPDEELRDLRENATASDMLDELESRVGPVERSIYEYVEDHYGESEANDPSWAIGPLAQYLEGIPVTVGAEERTLGDILKGM